MRKIITIVLLITFVYQSTSNLWIMVSFYAQQDYIAQNLCINRFDAIPVCKGQCYLSEKLEENEKKEQNFPDLKQKEIQLFTQMNLTIEFDKITYQEKLNIQINNTNHFPSSEFLFAVFHPPQLA